jgi:metallo-beta-lactamase class B
MREISTEPEPRLGNGFAGVMRQGYLVAAALVAVGFTATPFGQDAGSERPSAAIDGLRPGGVDSDASRIVEPIRIFDNLYYVGTNYVSAFLIATSDGLIMIDALHDEFAEQSLMQIQALGFDPSDIRYLIITHGHRDHFGGAGVIRARTGARVAMAEADWLLVGQNVPGLSRDVVLEDGQKLKVGSTTLHVYLTPGHTPGVTSVSFPVYDQRREHTAFLLGGHQVTGPWPGQADVRSALESMTASLQRLLRELPDVEVNLTSHPWGSLIFERAELLDDRKTGEPHPFVDAADFRAFLGERLGAHRERLASLSSRHP